MAWFVNSSLLDKLSSSLLLMLTEQNMHCRILREANREWCERRQDERFAHGTKAYILCTSMNAMRFDTVWDSALFGDQVRSNKKERSTTVSGDTDNEPDGINDRQLLQIVSLL